MSGCGLGVVGWWYGKELGNISGGKFKLVVGLVLEPFYA